jgi:hypothetical protein
MYEAIQNYLNYRVPVYIRESGTGSLNKKRKLGYGNTDS